MTARRSKVATLALVAVALAAGLARAEGVLRVRPAVSAEIIYNDGVELLFEESDPATRSGGDPVDNVDAGAGSNDSMGFGVDVDASASIEAHPFTWLSLQVRPELFAQIFFDRRGTLVVRLAPPLFIQAQLHPKLALLLASEYVANFAPYRDTFTFHRETATTRLRWTPLTRLQLDLQSTERVKLYPDRVDWDFRSHRVGVAAAVVVSEHVRLTAAWALQLNSGARALASAGSALGGSPTAEGWQHLVSAGVRLGWAAHLVEVGYQLRVARGGDAVAAVDQPLLSPNGTIEEDIDELSVGGYDKHIVELTYDVRLGSRVTGDLYARYSRKRFLALVSTADPSQLRDDDVWLIGATVGVRVARGLEVDLRALYHVNDSSDPEYTFRNLILGVGLRWER